MNAGYSAGWCAATFNQKLVSVEILCRARGDSTCRFIMSPAESIRSEMAKYQQRHPEQKIVMAQDIPGFFERRTTEDKVQRKAFQELKQQHLQLQTEREKVIALLNNMFPPTVVERVQMGEELLAERHPDVTIVFADVVDFSNLVTHVQDPTVIVNWLNDLFTMIDELTDKFGLEKIKTIGDAYMLAAGLSYPVENHLHVSLSFALELISTLNSLKDPLGHPVRMRIGVASGGPVCSGIVGKKKFVFDIWGDVVNVASRMQTLSEPNRIQCTEPCKILGEDSFQFEPRGSIQVKGKGTLNTYFCTGRK